MMLLDEDDDADDDDDDQYKYVYSNELYDDHDDEARRIVPIRLYYAATKSGRWHRKSSSQRAPS